MLVLGLAGCGGIQKGVFEDYSFSYQEVGMFRFNNPNLEIYSKEKNGGKIVFVDKNHDGRFDTIDLASVKKGDPVEKYANLEIGQKILDNILSESK